MKIKKNKIMIKQSNNKQKNLNRLLLITLSIGLGLTIEITSLGVSTCNANPKSPTNVNEKSSLEKESTQIKTSGNTTSVNTAKSPKEEVRITVDKIVSTVKEYPGASNTENRRAKLREIINPRFDFDEMSKRSLGPEWNNITEQERAEFVRTFSNLLAKTYLNRIETVEPGMVKIDGESIEPAEGATPARALVRTSVNKNGDVFPLHYRLIFKDNDWKVYDVIVENIGLVGNYRNEFAGIIRKDKFSGLLTKLKDKL